MRHCTLGDISHKHNIRTSGAYRNYFEGYEVAKYCLLLIATYSNVKIIAVAISSTTVEPRFRVTPLCTKTLIIALMENVA